MALTPRNLIERATAEGRTDIAEWIEAALAKASAEEHLRRAQPMTSDAGLLYPGRWYDVVIQRFSDKPRTLRHVTPVYGRWGNSLEYASGRTACHLSYTKVVSAVEIT